MNNMQGLSFEGYKNRVDDLQINIEISDAELAQALRMSDANEFYRIFNTRDGVFDVDQDVAGVLFAEYNQQKGNKQRWMTEKLYSAMMNPEVTMNFLAVVANKKYFPEEFVKVCKQVLVASVKQGANLYSHIASVVEAEQRQKEIYERFPSTEESWRELEKHIDVVQELFDMEKYTPYRPPLDALDSLANVAVRLEDAEGGGDEELIANLKKEYKEELENFKNVISQYDANVFSRIAQSKESLVKMTADPEKKISLQEKRKEALIAGFVEMAKRLEKERLERQNLDDEIQLQGLKKDDSDNDDNN